MGDGTVDNEGGFGRRPASARPPEAFEPTVALSAIMTALGVLLLALAADRSLLMLLVVWFSDAVSWILGSLLLVFGVGFWILGAMRRSRRRPRGRTPDVD